MTIHDHCVIEWPARPARTTTPGRVIADPRFSSLTGRTLYSLDRTLLVCRRTLELKTDPDIQIAESAVQVIKELEGDAGGGEEKPALAREESEQASIQDDHAEKSSRRKGEQLIPERGKKQEDTGQPDQ